MFLDNLSSTSDISNYPGIRGKNFYEEDPLLQRILLASLENVDPKMQKDVLDHVFGYGKIAGSILDKLTDEAHQEGKYGKVLKFDKLGNRIETVEYCYEQREIRRINYEYGIGNLDYHPGWPHPFSLTHRMALAYIANQNGEGGLTCPLAITESLIRIIEAIGSDDQKDRYLPLIAGEESESHFMCGQYITERVGGSSISKNRTVAHQDKKGIWHLKGEKWFCSNPGDLWVTTARIENTERIGLFLVPRKLPSGKLNGYEILCKKDLVGFRGMLTVEKIYHDVIAEPIGRTTHGMANLVRYIINTFRSHVTVAAMGKARRAFLEAREYVQYREAYGKKMFDLIPVKILLAKIQIFQSVLNLQAFEAFGWNEENRTLASLANPLLKDISTSFATWATQQAMILHGGNGILSDFSCLPRLHNDAITNQTWEGAQYMLNDNAIKAYQRPKVEKALRKVIEDNLTQANNITELQTGVDFVYSRQTKINTFMEQSKEWVEDNRTHICKLIYQKLALSTLIAEAARAYKQKSPVFQVLVDMVDGFQEIAQFGKDGATRIDGPFTDKTTLDRIIFFKQS